MKFGILVFPGTWSDGDCFHAVTDVMGQDAEYVWHQEEDLSEFDCVVIPGGFSYGDYLRCGAIARFSPVMASVEQFAKQGGLVIGSCNGFQILCESNLLPGALVRNKNLEFICKWTEIRVENIDSPFTALASKGQVLRIPISHGEGNYYADRNTLKELEDENRILFKYCTPEGNITEESNPNGSLMNIAGVTNTKGNVLGMMPHPERCCESLLGGTDGKIIFESILRSVKVPVYKKKST